MAFGFWRNVGDRSKLFILYDVGVFWRHYFFFVKMHNNNFGGCQKASSHAAWQPSWLFFVVYKLCGFSWIFSLLGASLDRRSGKLIESKPKVLYEQMPIIYIYAINTTAGKDPKLYECPVYRKPQRTDQKYVGSIDFETDISPRHWTLRGVALLCDIK